jgi:hypothetical protein
LPIVTALQKVYTKTRNETAKLRIRRSNFQGQTKIYHARRLHQFGAMSHFNNCISTGRSAMTARIFKPAKNAMQSGTAKTKEWQLDYEPEQPRVIEPLMGWTSSGDMKQQLTLRFDTREDAVAYCEREGIPHEVIEPKEPARRQIAYADNFAFRRGEPWTH